MATSLGLLPANAEQIWNDLIGAGATPVQAAGIMGNMIQESDLNPESVGLDTNGAYSRGLVQWNDAGAGRGVNWSQYITGNPTADMAAQVGLIKAQGGFGDASGADPYNAGVNFAHQFEACAECGIGGAQLPIRGAAASTVYQVAQSGNWSLGTGTLPPQGQGLPPTDTQNNTQLTGFSWNPITDWGKIWNAAGGLVTGPEKLYKAGTALFSMLLNPDTWLRTGEVILGVIVGAAGVALYAIVLAGEHPDTVMNLAALIPGEGQVARVATGAATSAARTGRASATVAGARKAAAPRRAAAPRPDVTPAGTAARSATRSASGTARKAAGQSEWTRAARTRERNRRLASQWGPAAASDEDREADDWAEARERSSRRSNRAAYRRQMDTRDLRRRTS